MAALAIISCMAATACTKDTELILASTTSTQDSGLFDELIPAFEKASGYRVKVIAVGSGEAIKLGEKGEADVLLVHSRKAEDQFVADGYGINRKDVMHNDFIIVGPESDPAKIKGMESAVEALKAIADSGSVYQICILLTIPFNYIESEHSVLFNNFCNSFLFNQKYMTIG